MSKQWLVVVALICVLVCSTASWADNVFTGTFVTATDSAGNTSPAALLYYNFNDTGLASVAVQMFPDFYCDANCYLLIGLTNTPTDTPQVTYADGTISSSTWTLNGSAYRFDLVLDPANSAYDANKIISGNGNSLASVQFSYPSDQVNFFEFVGTQTDPWSFDGSFGDLTGPVLSPNFPPTPSVPEPSSLLLLGSGLVLAAKRFRK